ncbi:hypothetical protein LWI29_024079 [Acer saccharum]|uniref:Uncharacterized protein n=1 Tax=Acer saccharum TaxID=4024 RepID=A0AA39VY44_ACESA|nr:hypothetical protein LWI29_024079 [Acer saccharum]
MTGDGKEIWVFDIDETILSNLPYFAKHGFGTNSTYPSQQISRALLSPANHTIECRLEDEGVDEEALEVAEALLLKNLLNFSLSVADVVLPDPIMVPIDRNLILWNTRLLNYWKTSPYHLKENVEKNSRQQQKQKRVRWTGMKKIDDYFDEIEQ